MGIITRKPADVIAAATAQQQGAVSRQASGLQIVAQAISPTGIDGTDFHTSRITSRKSMGILYARTGMGKTHFVSYFVCPNKPLAYISTDGRADEVVERAREELGRKIYLADCFVPGEVLSMGHEEALKHGQIVLEMVMRNLRGAVRMAREGKVGVIAIEHLPEIEEMIKLAVRGRVDRPKGNKEDPDPLAWGKGDNLVNTQMNAIAAMGRQSGAHFIMLGRAREIYENHNGTGRYSCHAHWRFQESADWIMELRRSDVMSTGKKLVIGATSVVQQKPAWELEVTKSGVEDASNGISQLFQTYTEQEWAAVGGPFVWSMLNLYPGSVIEDWT